MYIRTYERTYEYGQACSLPCIVCGVHKWFILYVASFPDQSLLWCWWGWWWKDCLARGYWFICMHIRTYICIRECQVCKRMQNAPIQVETHSFLCSVVCRHNAYFNPPRPIAVEHMHAIWSFCVVLCTYVCIYVCTLTIKIQIECVSNSVASLGMRMLPEGTPQPVITIEDNRQ